MLGGDPSWVVMQSISIPAASTDQPEIADYLFVNALENERGPRIFRIGRSSIIAADIEALRDESNSADHIGRTPDTPPKSAELSYGVVRRPPSVL